MKFKYDIYTCNNGNPTAIITNCKDEKMYEHIAEKIYKKHSNVDQVAVIINISEDRCTFQLVNGEFCGNACLSVGAFMHEHYKINNGTIINKVTNKNNSSELIEIESKYNGETGNLLIPKNLFLKEDQHKETESYIVKMNGIIHTIIPHSFGIKNEQYAIKKIEELEKNITSDVLGIIFLENGQIDPFIWIKRIKLLQHQDSCLSGSIAALEYLQNKEGLNEKRIIQPTGEAYDIKIKENHIDITGTIRKIDTGIVEVEKMLIKDIREKISTKEFAHCTDAILSLVLEKPRTDIKEDDLISEEFAKYCEELATDFTKSYELIYKRGKTHFMDIPLIITKDVFPPVFATEPFINEILSKFGDKKRILEIGTGSGAMAIAIAKNKKDSEIIATDISEEILKVTKQNIELNKINNVKVLKSDLFKEVTGKFDLILSNPPQQKTEALNKADKEGKLITPKVASDGGKDGFDLYNKIKNQAKEYLTEDGVLVLQHDGNTNIYKYSEL